MKKLMTGAYRRPESFSPMFLGWTRMGGHISGVCFGFRRRGWFVSWLRATPCRHLRRLEEIERRVERTVAYLDELRAGALDPDTRLVADAARRSLINWGTGSEHRT